MTRITFFLTWVLCSVGTFAHLLQGYVKDDTIQSFSRSPVAATSFCQSLLGTVTSTVTTRPRTSTLTTTKTTTANAYNTTSTTLTLSSTSTVNVNTTLTFSTTVATTTVPITASVTTVTSSTATITSSTTLTVTASGKRKRWGPPAPAFPPAFNPPGIPTSLLTSACSYFGVKPATTTKTVIAATPSTTVTLTATQTNTIPVTVSTNVTVTSATTTLTSSITTTLNLTSTTSTTTTQNITSTFSTTTTLVQTSTTTILPPLQTVALTVHNSQDLALASSGGIGYPFLYYWPQGKSVYFLNFTTDRTTNPKFTINPSTGEFKALTGPGDAPGESFWCPTDSFFQLGPADWVGPLCNCQVLSSGKLQCQYHDNGIGVLWTCWTLLLVTPSDQQPNCGAATPYQVDVFAEIL